MASHFFNFKFHRHNKINLANVDKERYKYGNLLIFACFFIYTVSMAAKGIYAAQTKFIVDLWKLDYATASLANTYYFVTYGLVQVGLFFLMNKISMRKYILWTVPFAGVAIALIGMATNISQIWIYFGISGAFQAGIFAGCTLMLTRYLPVKQLSKANMIMNMGYAIGTVLAYLLSALFIGFGGESWRIPYYIIGALTILSVLTFGVIVYSARRFTRINNILDKKILKELESGKTNAIDDNDPLITLKSKKKTVVFYIVDLIMTFLITAVYYCVMNYITSLLVDVHGLSQDISIYVSTIAPIAITIGPVLIIRSCDHHKDFVKQSTIYMGILIPLVLIITLFYEVNMWLFLVLAVAFVVIANAVKSAIISIMAYKLRNVVNSGSYSAITNAVASVSAGVTPTIMGVILGDPSVGANWNAFFWVTTALVVFVFVALVVIDIIVRKDYRKEHHMTAEDKI